MKVVSGYFSIVKFFLFSIFIFMMVGCSGNTPSTYYSSKAYVIYSRSCPQFYESDFKSSTNNRNELLFDLYCERDAEQYVLRSVDAGIYNNFSYYDDNSCESHLTGNLKNLPPYEFQAGKIYYLGHFNITQGQDYLHFNKQMDKYIPYKPMPNRYEKVVLNRQIIDKIVDENWFSGNSVWGKTGEGFWRLYLGVFSLGMSEVLLPRTEQAIGGALVVSGYNIIQCKDDAEKFSKIVDTYQTDEDFSFELECTKEKIPTIQTYSSLKIEDNFMAEHQKINGFIREKMPNTTNIAVENLGLSKVIYEYYPIVSQYCPPSSD